MLRNRRARLLLAVGVTGLLLGLVLWRGQPGNVASTAPNTPQDCLSAFREAVSRNDLQNLRTLLSQELRSQQDQIVAQQQSRLAQTISWLIVRTQTQPGSAQVLVHEVHRDGWIYPVQYDLFQQGNSWLIARISYLPPEKSPIAPGTHISEAPLGVAVTAPAAFTHPPTSEMEESP